MPHSTGSVTARIGFVLTRVVVPLWVLAGALFKLAERNPANLPSGIRQIGLGLDIDLHVLLATLISAEILIAAVMIFVPRLARAAAIFMLSVFCLVLLNEMRLGNFTSCGCLGDVPVKPWQMLTIDGTLLLGVVLFRPRVMPSDDRAARLGPIAALASVVLGALASFGLILPERATPIDPPTPVSFDSTHSADSSGQPADPTINPNPLPVPPSWYLKTAASDWVGKPWREFDLFRFMPKWPRIEDTGKHYVVFYSRSCEHCQQMFENYLIIELDAPVTAVEIPASKTELRAADAWDMLENPCELMELPLGCNWLITPPLALTIENGKITCAVEGEAYEQCLGIR